MLDPHAPIPDLAASQPMSQSQRSSTSSPPLAHDAYSFSKPQQAVAVINDAPVTGSLQQLLAQRQQEQQLRLLLYFSSAPFSTFPAPSSRQPSNSETYITANIPVTMTTSAPYGQQRKPWQSHIDMYRKLPIDLMEGSSRRGSILSYFSLALMAVLLASETRAYFATSLKTDLQLDRSDDPKIRLNFNITMLDLKCDWAVIDVVSVLGTDQNVTAHVTKWNVDGEGVRKGYKGRNRNQKDIVLYDESIEESIEELHENGEDAISLDEQTLQIFKKEHEYLFVDFYASWCSHCKDLAPTWETLAEVMVDAGKSSYSLSNGEKHLDDYSEEDYEHALRVHQPVVIAKVDCVLQPKVCNLRENIRAYPTLRLFIDGKPWAGGSDYKGHRTVQEMVDWLAHMEEQHKTALEKEGDEGEKLRKLHAAHDAARQRMGEDESEAEQWREHQKHQMKRIYHEWRESEHPGCQLSGHLLLDRAPGNFHILARSKHHDLAPHLTNVSHMVNTLSIGDPMAGMKIINGEAIVPEEVKAKISPMDGNVYTTMALHESYHHYLKVITTKAPGLQIGRRDLKAYQIIPSSQLAYYRNDMVPEAKFAYDLSPISVSYRQSSRHWYDYCTSVFALIGGIFTMVGLIESSIQATLSKTRRGSTRGYRR